MPKCSIEVSEQAGVRYLHFGSPWIQGAMRLRDPYALELEYTQVMAFSLLLQLSPKRILLVGLGAGSLVRFFYRQCPAAKLTVVEIDPRVVPVCREEFSLPDDPNRIRLEIADATQFVRECRSEFDLILVDGFDAKASAGKLDSKSFYADCRSILGPQGLMVTNLFGRVPRFVPSLKRLWSVFGDRVLVLPPCEAGNVIAIAACGKRICLSWAQLEANAVALKLNSGLNLIRWTRRVQRELATGDCLVL